MKKIIYIMMYVIVFTYSKIVLSQEIYNPKIYEKNGTYYKIQFYNNKSELNGPTGYDVYKCSDSSCSSKSKIDWQDFNFIINDNYNEIASYKYHDIRRTYILDDKNQIVAAKNTYNGAIVETYKYTDSGKILVYLPDGTLKGAYTDFLDSQITSLCSYVGNPYLELNENGEFYDYAEDGKTILGIYATNGDITNYKYDDKGNLLNIIKNGDVIAENKYDAGGNLVASYENGIQTYHRTSYTIKEANDATPDSDGEYSVKFSF